MAKTKIVKPSEANFEEPLDNEFEEEETEFLTELPVDEKPIDQKQGKTRFIVYANQGDNLILEDERGCGRIIPVPKGFEEIKKGEVIYI